MPQGSLAFALRHFNPYLVGKEFLIRTDHKPNLSIIKGKTILSLMKFNPFCLFEWNT